jgi:hypothetical protein
MDVIARMVPWVTFFAACWMTIRTWRDWRMAKNLVDPKLRAKGKRFVWVMTAMTAAMWVAAIAFSRF